MNKLSRLSTKSSIESILKKAQEESFLVLGWKIVGQKKYTAEAKIRIFSKSKNYLVISGLNKRSSAMLIDIVSSKENINFFIPDSMILFQSKMIEINDDQEIIVSVPEFIALVDRREKLRLSLDEIIKLNVKFSKSLPSQNQIIHHFAKILKDISSSGMSFYISKMESRFFKINDEIIKISIKIDGHTMTFAGKVINIENVDPNVINKLNYKAIKIGVKFNHISSANQKIIDQFVFKYIDLSLNVV